MPNTREKLIKLLRGSIHFHEEKDEAWIIGGKQGERPSIFDSEADYIIAHGVGFLPRWIPVTERLPEEYKAVFVCYKSGTVYINYIRQGGKWNCIGDDITHWMPLPEPPKED